MEKKLESIESEQFIILHTPKNRSKNDCLGGPNNHDPIPKNIDIIGFDDYLIILEYNYYSEKYKFKNNFNYGIDYYIFFNPKKIIIYEHGSIDNKSKFLYYYLENKKDFMVDEIEIYDNRLIDDAFTKYTNYKKLLIKYDKNFNDSLIKNHCRLNNIIFDYTSDK
jgi:acetyltransferase-like isoleucine patch superfamily enzyme